MIKKQQKENTYLPSAVGISEFEVDLGRILANNNNKKLADGSRRSKYNIVLKVKIAMQ